MNQDLETTRSTLTTPHRLGRQEDRFSRDRVSRQMQTPLNVGIHFKLRRCHP